MRADVMPASVSSVRDALTLIFVRTITLFSSVFSSMCRRVFLLRVVVGYGLLVGLIPVADAALWSLPDGVGVVRDFAYGPDRDQTMDIYRLNNRGTTPAPVIFMVHGGAWRFGDKSARSVVENKLARWVPEGFVFISVNYPMLPGSPVTAQANDIALALATAQQHAAEWGGDPAKFILMGHSAGAHLVALINADPERAVQRGARPWLGTVSLDSGAMNVVTIMSDKHARLYDAAFGTDPALWKSLSPYYVLTARALPWLNVCSTKRDTSCTQSAQLLKKSASLGVRGGVLPENLTHREINNELGKPGAYTRPWKAFMASLDSDVAARLKAIRDTR